MGLFNVLDQVINAVVIKAHTVDQTFGIDQAEQSWLIVAGLWTRGHGADLDRAKSHRAQGINTLPVLVQTSSQTKRIFKG